MDVLPVGLSTGCFYQRRLLEVLKDVADSGISIIEICSYPAHLNVYEPSDVKAAAAEIKGHGMQPFSFHAPFARELDITSLNDEQRSDSLLKMLTAVEAAGVLGVKCFVIHPGPEREGKVQPLEHRQRLNNAAKALGLIARRCADQGIQLVLENMLPHLLLGGVADLLWLMDILSPWKPGFCLDTGHAHLAGNLAGMASLLPQQLTMIHAADNKGVIDEHLPPGLGGIDWSRLLGQLDDLNFQGTLILELASDDSKKPRELLADALLARQLIWRMAETVSRPSGVFL